MNQTRAQEGQEIKTSATSTCVVAWWGLWLTIPESADDCGTRVLRCADTPCIRLLLAHEPFCVGRFPRQNFPL